MNKIIILIQIIVLQFLSVIVVNAEVTVEIKDTTTNGNYITLPVTGITGDFNGKNIEYKFEFNYAQAQVLNVSTLNNYAFKDIKWSYNNTDRVLTVASENVLPNFTGKLFDIALELLPKMDFYQLWEKLFTITPKSVRIFNQTDDTTIILPDRPVIVNIDTFAAKQTFFETISHNYPNPFSWETIVFFSIEETTPLKISVFDFGGSIIQHIPEEADGALEFHFFDAFNKEIIVTDNYNFPQGVYKLLLKVNPERLAVGSYRLLFQTNKIKSAINVIYAN